MSTIGTARIRYYKPGTRRLVRHMGIPLTHYVFYIRLLIIGRHYDIEYISHPCLTVSFMCSGYKKTHSDITQSTL